MKKSKENKALIYGAGALLSVLFLGFGDVNPAQAGFEWNPPTKQKTAKHDPMLPPPLPSETLLSTAKKPGTQGLEIETYPLKEKQAIEAVEALNKMLGGTGASNAMPPAPAPQINETPLSVTAAPVAPVTAAPVVEAESMAAPAAIIPAGPAMKETVAYEQTLGFGRDIPLALAMQQIVPPGYAYSFDPAIQPGIRVSWDGGQPWNEVLEQAVQSHGYVVVIVDKTVWLRPKGAPENIYNPPLPQQQAGQSAISQNTAMMAPAPAMPAAPVYAPAYKNPAPAPAPAASK